MEKLQVMRLWGSVSYNLLRVSIVEFLSIRLISMWSGLHTLLTCYEQFGQGSPICLSDTLPDLRLRLTTLELNVGVETSMKDLLI